MHMFYRRFPMQTIPEDFSAAFYLSLIFEFYGCGTECPQPGEHF